MGRAATARLCYGVWLSGENMPDPWTFAERIPDDAPLQCIVPGADDWPDEERGIVLFVKKAEVHARETPEQIDLPDVCTRCWVNARKLWKHLGLPGEYEPRWLLVPEYG